MAYTIYKPTTAVRGVLFDMDGVILDTEKLYTRFWLEGAHALGFPMTREQAIGLRGMNLGEAARMIGTYFGSPDYYQPIKNKRIELMDAYIAQHGVEPKAGIREILEYLKENHIPRAVCTASPIERVKRYLIPWGCLTISMPSAPPTTWPKASRSRTSTSTGPRSWGRPRPAASPLRIPPPGSSPPPRQAAWPPWCRTRTCQTSRPCSASPSWPIPF